MGPGPTGEQSARREQESMPKLTAAPPPESDPGPDSEAADGVQPELEPAADILTEAQNLVAAIDTVFGRTAKAAAKKAATKPAKQAAAKADPWKSIEESGGPVTAEEIDFGFQPLTDADDFLNVLMYGPEGTGKSTNIAKMANLPGATRVLIISAEGGLKKLALIKRGVDVDKIVSWPPRGQTVTFEALKALHRKLLADLEADPNSWSGVGMDSGTEVHQALLEQAFERRIVKALDRNLEVDLDVLEGEDYGTMGQELRILMRRFRDLPCHFAITALERTDKKTGMAGPAFSPSIGGDIRGYVDMVLACRATQHAPGEDDENDQSLAEFRALTRQGKATHAKDRFDVLPRVLAEPGFDRLHGYLTGALKEDTDPIQQAYVDRAAEEKARREEEEKARETKKLEARAALLARRAGAKK